MFRNPNMGPFSRWTRHFRGIWAQFMAVNPLTSIPIERYHCCWSGTSFNFWGGALKVGNPYLKNQNWASKLLFWCYYELAKFHWISMKINSKTIVVPNSVVHVSNMWIFIFVQITTHNPILFNNTIQNYRMGRGV